MRLERSDVEFPIWRKKVDKSLFEHNGTTVPEWAFSGPVTFGKFNHRCYV